MADRLQADVVIVGGGIAGASVAANLASDASIVLVEREVTLAHHSTGRSAAAFLESYGGPAIRALTQASRAELEAAPDDGETPPLLSPRALLWLARVDQRALLDALARRVPSLSVLDEASARAVCPVLRPGYVAAAGYEPDAADIDVLALHGRFVRTARRAGAVVRTSAGVVAITADGTGDSHGWRMDLSDGATVSAGVLVNAAGAWADRIASMAGAPAVGLRPLRRTIAIGRPRWTALDPHGPLLSDIGEGFYCKPEGPNVLLSPADETPTEPCDVRPDELDVAIAIERVNKATLYDIASVVTTWSGLRTFAPDRNLVVGFDASVPGLFWLAGQGGYGIQTSPALGRVAAALIVGRDVPDDVVAAGLDVASLRPGRFG